MPPMIKRLHDPRQHPNIRSNDFTLISHVSYISMIHHRSPSFKSAQRLPNQSASTSKEIGKCICATLLSLSLATIGPCMNIFMPDMLEICKLTINCKWYKVLGAWHLSNQCGIKSKKMRKCIWAFLLSLNLCTIMDRAWIYAKIFMPDMLEIRKLTTDWKW